MRTIFTLFFIILTLPIFGQASFEKFKVEVISIKVKHPIVYKSNPSAQKFKTRITNGYNKNGINFAGQYSFIYWGCGSPCQASVIVDSETGKVYNGPAAAIGYDYQKNSRLLIVNPPDSSKFFIDCPYCIEEKWLWNEEKKRFEKLDE